MDTIAKWLNMAVAGVLNYSSFSTFISTVPHWNTVQEWSPLRIILSACEKNSDKSLVTSVFSKHRLVLVLFCSAQVHR